MTATSFFSLGAALTVFLVGAAVPALAQRAAYDAHAAKADSLFRTGAYERAADLYSQAFEANGWKGSLDHRIRASKAWAQAGVPDSAFFQLRRVIDALDYADVGDLKDPLYAPLHSDDRWGEVTADVAENKRNLEKDYQWDLVAQLDSVYTTDQMYRSQVDSIFRNYGTDSEEWRDLIAKMGRQDSLNQIVVLSILDEHGWLPASVVSQRGNTALFLVIQHADAATRAKYLPMMREAAAKGHARGSDLALVEDRSALENGKHQIYGSQIGQDEETGNPLVLPLADPDHVDARRAEVGLEPIADYLKRFGGEWDLEAYKQMLPELEKKFLKKP